MLVLGRRQLTTRMYTSLGEIVAGWSKNLFVAGRETAPFGRIGRELFTWLFPLPALMTLAGPFALAAWALGTGPTWLHLFGGIVSTLMLGWWMLVYWWMDAPVRYALLYPLGALVFLGILILSLARGRRVAWKGRQYLARGL